MPGAPPVGYSLWRDSDLLVMGEGAELPQLCMKCNTSNDVALKVLDLSHVGKYNFALLLLGFILYRTYRVPVTLCGRHQLSGHGTTKKASLLLMLMGALAFVYGFSTSSNLPLMGGVIIVVVGIFLLAVGSDSFAIEKRAESNIWLRGVGAQYLAALPRWPGEV